MEIDPDYLPAGVHVIASVEAYGEEHPPRESGRNTTVLVSASGQLAIYHPNHVAEAVIEIGNISKLESLELVPRTVIKKKSLMFWKLCMIYSIVIWLVWTIGANMLTIDQMQNGYVTASSSDVSEGVDTNVLYEGIIIAFFGIFLTFTLFGPWLFAYLGEQYVPRYVRQRHLKLSFEDGSEYSIFEGPEWSAQYRLLSRLLWVFFVSLIIMMIPSSEFIIVLVVLVISGIIGAFAGLAASYVSKDDEAYEVGTLRPGHLLRFHHVITEIHESGHTVDGEQNGDEPGRLNQSVMDRIGVRIEKPLEELYTFEDELNELTDGEWTAMLTVNKVYFALAHIRRCTEKMLFNLTIANGIKVKAQNRGIQTMKNVLNRDDVLNPDVIKWLDIIKAIANPAAHDFKEDINDYLTAFRAFVSITAWYVDITAPNREEE